MFLRFLFLVVPLILNLLPMLTFLYPFLYFKSALSSSFFIFLFLLLSSTYSRFMYSASFFLTCLLLLLLCLLSKVPGYYTVSNCQLISSRYSGTTYTYNITQIICTFFMNSLYVFHA